MVQRHEKIEPIPALATIPCNYSQFNTHFACVSSRRHTPLSFASRLLMIPFLFFSFSAFCLSLLAFSSFLARLSRAGFSRRIWRPWTRLAYIPPGSDVWRRDVTYVGINGAVLLIFMRLFCPFFVRYERTIGSRSDDLPWRKEGSCRDL